MSKHIDFDEFVDFFNCRELTETSVSLAQKINAHILQCEECKRMYNATRAFYDVAFNDSLDSDLFNPIENIRLLIKFKVKENVKIMIDHMSNMLYRYDYPIPLGAREIDAAHNIDFSTVIDEDNGLNTVRIDNNMCKIEIDKEDWGNVAPIIFVKDITDEIVFSGVMEEDEDVYYINIPITAEGYSVYVSAEGCK
jgi:hypothetical protein